VDPQNCIDNLERLSKDFDYAVVVAPPKELVEITRTLHAELLQPSPHLIEVLSNKYTAIQVLRECGISTPDTRLVNVYSDVVGEEMSLPVVVKPTLLTGAACVEVVRSPSELNRVVQGVAECSSEHEVVVQRLVEGVHGSVLAFYGSDESLLYSANLQLISSMDGKLRFFGGLTPLRSNVFRDSGRAIISKLKMCIPGLRGFVGVDVVWSGGEPFVVEVNPRPTTAIVSLAKLFQKLSQGIVENALLSDAVTYAGDVVTGYSYYVKAERGFTPFAELGEDIIVFPYSEKVIVVGEVKNPLQALDRVKSFVKNLVYDLDAVLLTEARIHVS
jgi:predicted ATP-grasp superfamily ATP-dependent carboligase